jgi:prepilin-type N-terminal cleavage/methylation domain-containing protein
MKRAFSLIEVILVLVILGIVASLSSQIIVQVYDNYITQKALYNTTTKTELVVNQIVNRLSYAIDSTIIVKDPITIFPYETNNSHNNWIRLIEIPHQENNYTAIEWIGFDNDSFSAGAVPYWSGVANYETAFQNSFITPASQLNRVKVIMSNLSNNEVNLTDTNPAAVIFTPRTGEDNNPACMGLVDETNVSCIYSVKIGNNDRNLTFTRLGEPKIITERYKLAWSAYALVPEDSDGDGLYDLYLYYNYQPWNSEKYRTDGTKKLLITNVSVFKFTENGGVIQLKLCASENIGQNFNISSCKEKAIIR